MALEPAITDLEQLKGRPEVALPAGVEGGRGSRAPSSIAMSCRSTLSALPCARHAPRCKNDSELNYDSLADVTCVDWKPSDPRFEVIYHLFSTVTKKRVRLKVRLSGDDASVDSITPIWPGADFL